MDLEKILPKDGPTINEVTKYIEKYKNDLIVIKYGGNVLIDRNVFNNFITDLSVLNKLGLSTVVIHGGGPRIKRELEKCYSDEGPMSLNYQSCEMIARELAKYIQTKYPNRALTISVAEDNENGCELVWE